MLGREFDADRVTSGLALIRSVEHNTNPQTTSSESVFTEFPPGCEAGKEGENLKSEFLTA
jgi:hypothetical protein